MLLSNTKPERAFENRILYLFKCIEIVDFFVTSSTTQVCKSIVKNLPMLCHWCILENKALYEDDIQLVFSS